MVYANCRIKPDLRPNERCRLIFSANNDYASDKSTLE
jgi:hypothetical protein